MILYNDYRSLFFFFFIRVVTMITLLLLVFTMRISVADIITLNLICNDIFHLRSALGLKFVAGVDE